VPVQDIDVNIGRAVREIGPQVGDPWQMFDALANIPTLVLRGALSDILSADTLARMHQRKADLLSVEIPDRGHVPLLNEPAALSAIDAFIEGL
jgi:pimeloyl-ACP methyl ester carboxylesterase